MAKSCHHSISRFLNPFSPHLTKSTNCRRLAFPTCSRSKSRAAAAAAASNKDEIPQHFKKSLRTAPRARRHLITISTTDGKYHGQWSCDYVLSLRELQLADLAEDGQKDADVFISLSVQKHAGFGFSIDGRIITSFNRVCSCCFSSYYREIDTTFDVWVLPSSRSNEPQLPEIGGSDPSVTPSLPLSLSLSLSLTELVWQVIYVKPGSEADLDSLIQDTIRLTASAKDTCSESCEKSAPMWQYTDGKRSHDPRWSRLLEIKNAM